MKFKLRQLEAFNALAQTGSITRVARALNISQPAASRLLSDFAKNVEFDVFKREGGRLVLTSESRHMLPEVQRILEGLDHLGDLQQNLSNQTAGHLRIACLPGFATSHLPNVLSQFLAQRPGVTVSLEPDRPERIQEWIIGQQYDYGITDGFTEHPALHSSDSYIRSVCILPDGHPLSVKTQITPQDLIDEKIIHTRRDSRFYKHLVHAFASNGISLKTWIEVRQFSTACKIIQEGQGASIISALDAEQYRHTGIIIRAFAPKILHRVSLLLPKSSEPSKLTREFHLAFKESLMPFLEVE
ncbi:transcriptional regulator, LysR family protein [Rhodobacterales bacterium HTCC2150]|nr:transcriptional regulator, LysR family protein [Rhodobacterales bacterium HTCC2150] [Rhodobacteraceae bacterium HTCC2150]